MMKKILLPIMLVTLIFVACEEENPPKPTASLKLSFSKIDLGDTLRFEYDFEGDKAFFNAGDGIKPYMELDTVMKDTFYVYKDTGTFNATIIANYKYQGEFIKFETTPKTIQVNKP